MILYSFYAFLGALGFGILFNIQGKKLLFSAIGGGLGWFFYLLTSKYTTSDVVSFFVSAVVVSTYAEIMARTIKTPVTIFVICGLIPLVPGGGMYYTMLEVVRGNITKSMNMGLQTLSIAGAIAVGVAFVSSTTKIIFSFKHKKL